MKKGFLFLSLATLALMSFVVAKHEIVYNVNAAQSNVNWKGYKVTGEHSGTIAVKNGSLRFNHGNQMIGGSFEIDMNSLKCTDLQGDGAAKLEGHLKADDFFGVAKYPVAKFVTTRVVHQGKDLYKIIGNMTIKETTKEIKFTATVSDLPGQKIATAKVRLDRTDFDVRYGSGSFFDGLGDKTIYDEFDLDIKLSASMSK